MHSSSTVPGARVSPADEDVPRTAAELRAGSGIPPVERAVAIMALLRSSEGCPWDREQTFDTIKQHTLEETYEVFDAIERRSWVELRDELGDLLLQVLFYAQMASEAGYFGIEDVAEALNAKLIRRHPHIFGEPGKGGEPDKGGEPGKEDVPVTDAGAVLRRWEQIKQEEKGAAGVGALLLADVSRAMPAMTEARKLGSRAARVGFDWPEGEGLVEKLREEVEELRVEMVSGPDARREARRDAVEDELGDLLFTAVQVARHAEVDAESALRRANAKFRARFTAMEKTAGGAEALKAKTPEELELMWQEAKQMRVEGESK